MLNHPNCRRNTFVVLPRRAIRRRRGGRLEGLQRGRRASPQGADLGAVVLVRDLPGAVVDLELGQRAERLVALLQQGKAALLQRVDAREAVLLWPNLRL